LIEQQPFIYKKFGSALYPLKGIREMAFADWRETYTMERAVILAEKVWE